MWPKTREQRDWFHKLGNILDKLPRRLQPRVKAALHEVMYTETRAHARDAITRFAAEYPKAVTTLEKDADALLTFFDYPAEHWKHLRTSNVIESPFAAVRLRQRVTKGAGSRTKGLGAASAGLQGWERNRRLHVTVKETAMASVSKRKLPARKPISSRQKVQAHRERLRAQGLRPIQIWVPDTRSPKFAAEASRQSRRVAASRYAAKDQEFIDAISLGSDE